ncbi:hypothetical protein ABVT39_004528, partial [Epinephelus coioides]
VQQLSVVKEEVPPEQQEWSSSVDQEDPEPPHIKEEQEELWISQEGEQLQGLEEDDITKFTSTPVSRCRGHVHREVWTGRAITSNAGSDTFGCIFSAIVQQTPAYSVFLLRSVLNISGNCHT